MNIEPESVVLNPVVVAQHEADVGSEGDLGPGAVGVAVSSAHCPVTADLEGQY